MSSRRILLVDDEESIRKALRRTLKREGYDVLMAGDAREGLQVLQQQQAIDLVISDNHMPDMLGVDFLTLVRDRHPEVIRILLTANADTDTAIRAINEGQIFRFLTKPWDDDALVALVAAGMAQVDNAREHRRIVSSARGYANKVIVQS